MEFELIKETICIALKKVILNDSILIQVGQERALCHRFAMYLNTEFTGWNVDCEYNRVGGGSDPKNNEKGDRRQPDIIIHRRRLKDKENNLVFIEIKINNGSVHEDDSKIKEFTSSPKGSRKVQYQYGLSLSFLPETSLLWYCNGQQISASRCTKQ